MNSNFNDVMNPFFNQAQNFAAPMVKANKMAVANLEKVVDFQLKTWQKYTEMSLDAIKAAAEIDSPKAFQAYVTKQAENATAVRQEVMDDFKAWAEIGTDIREDFNRLAEQNTADLKAASSKSSKKAA